MSGAFDAAPHRDPADWGRPAWLPPWGRGNGFDARVWIPIADTDELGARAALVALRTKGLPGWTARLSVIERGRHRPSRYWRVWVDASHLGTSEEAVRRSLTGRATQPED
jgi:hypothetical protein